MIEVGEAQSRLVHELRDARHLLEPDPADLVAVGVVVGVQAGGEKDDRDALGRVAVVVASRVELLEIRRIVELVMYAVARPNRP